MIFFQNPTVSRWVVLHDMTYVYVKIEVDTSDLSDEEITKVVEKLKYESFDINVAIQEIVDFQTSVEVYSK